MSLDHLPESIRGKVETDLRARVKPDGSFRFDVANDYQLHLYSLHLRLEGKSEEEVADILLSMPLQVPERKKAKYVDDIVHSLIVGFPSKEGGLLPVYIKAT